jgi:pyruvate/2-oxoglutarate dehydrogenase complex dihydrolipoamide dehydrogenase (E3) component
MRVSSHLVLSLGTRATVPDVPGLIDTSSMTHVEALDLEHVPDHLIVTGGGYVGLELAQAARRFGSSVTVIEHGSQLALREDPDVGAALLELFQHEEIEVLLGGPTGQIAARQLEAARIGHALRRAEELPSDVAAAIEGEASRALCPVQVPGS